MGQVMDTQRFPGVAGFDRMPGVRTTDVLVAAPLVGFVVWLIARFAQRGLRDLPPGPKGLPLVGDVFHIVNQSWLVSPQRKDEYGDTPHSQCHQKPAHVPFFRRDDVCKRPWAGDHHHQQPPRRH